MKALPLRGKGAGQLVLVSDEDFGRAVEAGPWFILDKSKTHNTNYVRRSGRRPALLHVFIMGGVGVDHINGNGLDNRRENLRFATPSQNGGNQRKKKGHSSTPYKGVVKWTNECGTIRFRARITKDGRSVSLGCYDTAEEAARAYDRAALDVFEEFAQLNFPTAGKRSAAA